MNSTAGIRYASVLPEPVGESRITLSFWDMAEMAAFCMGIREVNPKRLRMESINCYGYYVWYKGRE